VEYRRILLDGEPVAVTVDGDTLVTADGRRIEAATATHLAPVVPSKILCCHLNHVSRVREFGISLAPAPTWFQKPVSALNAHGGDVVRPANCHYLNFEGEVAIIIGRSASRIALDEAADYIAGYSVANDFGLHDFRDTDAGSMLRVKGADTLCPVGPGITTDWDFRHKAMRTLVNGDVRQDGSTDEMAWDMHYLVTDLARLITLVPGDIILSGTPAFSRPVEPGDVVTVEVEGLGALTNRIVSSPDPVSDEVGAQPTATEEVLSTALGGDWEFRGQRRPQPTTPSDLPSPRVRPRYQS
jgi:5-oxopent-3-ene-1,2,5-tricarboxylate decarboxylase/2-hydroxyhepta-2,4-diene-1,7-dioate isomerase